MSQGGICGVQAHLEFLLSFSQACSCRLHTKYQCLYFCCLGRDEAYIVKSFIIGSESATAWTIQVVDRPTQGHLFLSRQYVQPQWVLDSTNFRVLADAELYAPGKHPPPHLSPFVSYDRGRLRSGVRQGHAQAPGNDQRPMATDGLAATSPVSACSAAASFS